MSEYKLFTSESVSEGHPDKMADQISDGILDAIISQDQNGRVAVETMVKTGMVVVAGEVSTSASIELEQIVRKIVTNIGYDNSSIGFDGGVLTPVMESATAAFHNWTADKLKHSLNASA